MKKIALITLLLSYSVFSYGLFDFEDEYVIDDVKVAPLINLQQLSLQAKSDKKAILIEFSAEDCAYCIKLEEEVLKPMIRSKDYSNKVFMRNVHIDSSDDIIDWQGDNISSADLADKYKVFVTPTVVIINDKGKEIVKRLVGINVVDYYSQDLDMEIDKAVLIINKKLP